MSTRAAGDRTAAALQLRHAGLVSRALADACDLAILIAAGAALLLVVAGVRYLVVGPPLAIPGLSVYVETSLGFVGAVLYLWYFWAATGRTPGKQLLGLRVVDRSEDPLDGGRAFLRAVLCVAFPAGLLWVLVSRRNASVQDLLLRTTVVYDWTYRRGRGRLSSA